MNEKFSAIVHASELEDVGRRIALVSELAKVTVDDRNCVVVEAYLPELTVELAKAGS